MARSIARQEDPRATLRISRRTFESIENFIMDNNASRVRAHQGIDLLVRYCALVVKSGAQSRSMGPVAPRHRSRPELAHRIPVQRISGRYFAGWHLRRLRSGVWLLYNDAVEAYLIEYGIYQRERRPILKMSVIDMLRFLQTTKTGDAFVDWILSSRRNAKGQFRSFERRIGSVVMAEGLRAPSAHIAGPTGSLPG